MQVQRGKRCITQQIRNAPTVIRSATYFISGSLPLVVCNWTHKKNSLLGTEFFLSCFPGKKHRKYNKFYFKKNKLSGYILITATETIPTWSWTSVEIFIMRNSCWTSRTQTNSVGHIKKTFWRLQGQRSSNPNIRGQDPRQEICVMWYNICLTNALKFNVATLDLQTASGLSLFFPLCAFSPSNHPQHQCTQT